MGSSESQSIRLDLGGISGKPVCGGANIWCCAPYWMLTEHGTVRCEYLNIEVLSEEAGAHGKAAAHFSQEEACRIEWSFLSDKLKECTVNPGKETDWSILFPRTEFPG